MIEKTLWNNPYDYAILAGMIKESFQHLMIFFVEIIIFCVP